MLKMPIAAPPMKHKQSVWRGRRFPNLFGHLISTCLGALWHFNSHPLTPFIVWLYCLHNEKYSRSSLRVQLEDYRLYIHVCPLITICETCSNCFFCFTQFLMVNLVNSKTFLEEAGHPLSLTSVKSAFLCLPRCSIYFPTPSKGEIPRANMSL